jgi:histidine ammonia-lyase
MKLMARSANAEDLYGVIVAIKTRQIIENAWYVVAIELMAAAQAFDLRAPFGPRPPRKLLTRSSVLT